MSVPDQRKLTAIVFTDMVGFSLLSQRDERLALKMLEEHRGIVRGVLPSHGGREVKTMGDGFLLEFSSAVDAVQAAVEIQSALHQRNQQKPGEVPLAIRVGLHVGDVIMLGDDIHGDGVNIAARLEPLAAPGGICISEDAARQVRNKTPHQLVPLGPAELKNIEVPMAVYRVALPWENSAPAAKPDRPAALRRRTKSSRRLSTVVAVGLGVAAIAGIGGWQLWRRPGPPPVGQTAGAKPAIDSPAAQATSPALGAENRPLEHVREIDRKGFDATRDEMRLAVNLCQNAIDHDPANAEAWSLLARINTSLYREFDRTPERLDAAQAAARSAITLAPNARSSRLALGRVYCAETATATVPQGKKILRELASEAPNDPEVLLALGFALTRWTYQANEDAPEGLRLFEQVLALRPGEPMALNGKAWALTTLRRHDEADAAWNEAIRTSGSPSAFVYQFYDLWSNRGRIDEATRKLGNFPPDLALRDMAARLVTYFWLGQHEPEKALAFLQPFPRSFVEDYYDDIPRGYLMGKAQTMAGRPEAARSEWQNALDAVDRKLAAQPGKPLLIQWKARLHYLLGDRAQAETQAVLYRQLRTTLTEAQYRGMFDGAYKFNETALAMEFGQLDDAVALMDVIFQKTKESPHELRIVFNRFRRFEALFPSVGATPKFKAKLAEIETALAESEATARPIPLKSN